MGHTPLSTETHRTTQKSARVASPVMAILHHAATTNADVVINMMVRKTRKVSAHAVVKDDRIAGVVEEEYRAWSLSSSLYDSKAFTVECANQSSAGWTISDASHEALARLVADWGRRYGFTPHRDGNPKNWTVIGHREVYTIHGQSYATACPGAMNLDYIAKRARELMGGAAPKPTTPSKPSTPAGNTGGSSAEVIGGITIDGQFGPQTITAMQRALGFSGSYVDGKFGPVTKKRLQSRLGQVPDGDFGSVSTKALQMYLGVTVDGAWGSQTTTALQRRLGAGNFNPGPRQVSGSSSPVGGGPARIVVDGNFGPQTVRRLQQYLGFTGKYVDGSFGAVTKKRLQKHLGQVQDGNFGAVSTKALQRRVGAVADGNWGKQTTTKLQEALNRNKI